MSVLAVSPWFNERLINFRNLCPVNSRFWQLRDVDDLKNGRASLKLVLDPGVF